MPSVCASRSPVSGRNATGNVGVGGGAALATGVAGGGGGGGEVGFLSPSEGGEVGLEVGLGSVVGGAGGMKPKS